MWLVAQEERFVVPLDECCVCVFRVEDYLLLKLTQAQAAGRVETRVSDLIMQQVCVCVCV